MQVTLDWKEPSRLTQLLVAAGVELNVEAAQVALTFMPQHQVVEGGITSEVRLLSVEAHDGGGEGGGGGELGLGGRNGLGLGGGAALGLGGDRGLGGK